MTGKDDVGMLPKIMVELAIELMEMDILPISRDHESDKPYGHDASRRRSGKNSRLGHCYN